MLSSGNFLDATRLLKVTTREKLSTGGTRLTYLVKVIGNVARENHLDNNLTDVPVLSLAEQLKDVVLGVEQKLEGNSAVMVFKNALVVVSECFGVSHCNQERIVHARVLDVTHKASKEGTHDIQVAQMLHQLTLFGKVVEVACQFNDFGDIVVAVLFVSCIFHAIDE